MKLGEGHNQGISEIPGQFQKHFLKKKVDFDIKSTRDTTFFSISAIFGYLLEKFVLNVFLAGAGHHH